MKQLHKLNYLFLLGLACIATFSCDGGLSTVVDVDLPDSDKQMAVHLDVSATANDTSYFNVTRILSEDSNDDGRLDDNELDVNITNINSGQSLITGQYSDYLNYAYTPSNLNPGDEIELTINYPGLETATCSVVVPDKAPIAQNLVVEPSVQNSFEDDYYPVSFTIDDGGGEDYYEVKFHLTVTTTELTANGDTVSIDVLTSEGYTDGFSEDPAIENSHNGFIISDDTFNGKTKKLEFNLTNLYAGIFEYFGGIPASSVESITGKMFFNKISKDRYNFERSYQNYLNSDGNPFGTPVTVFSNIENGHGIFSVSNGDVYELSY